MVGHGTGERGSGRDDAGFSIRSLFRGLAKLALLLALAYGSYQVASHFVVQTVQVVGSSMSPSLRSGDSYFLNRLVYLWRDPRPLPARRKSRRPRPEGLARVGGRGSTA